MNLKRPQSDNPRDGMSYLDHLEKQLNKSVEKGYCTPERKDSIMREYKERRVNKKYYDLKYLKNN